MIKMKSYTTNVVKDLPSTMTTRNVAQTVIGDLDLFGHDGQAKMYRDFRPVYPDELVQYVASLVAETNRDVYVDVACGSGQLTSKIAPFFRSATGVDKSFEQLGQAQDPKVEWKAGSAFALSMPDCSADLMTVAQGLHWLVPYDRFFSEVDRVLKPRGVFAAVAYAFPTLIEPESNRIVMHFYEEVLGARKSPGQDGCWWDTNRPTIDSFYADVPFPSHRQLRHFIQRVSLTIEHYTNYLKTLSAYRTLVRVTSPKVDPIDEIRDKLSSISSNGMIELEIDFFVVSYVKI